MPFGWCGVIGRARFAGVVPDEQIIHVANARNYREEEVLKHTSDSFEYS